MLKSLHLRLARLEAARSKGVIEIMRLRKDGGAAVTEIRGGRVTHRREVAPEEADRLARGGLAIERSYAAAERSAVTE
jgi:hypothetical protein